MFRTVEFSRICDDNQWKKSVQDDHISERSEGREKDTRRGGRGKKGSKVDPGGTARNLCEISDGASAFAHPFTVQQVGCLMGCVGGTEGSRIPLIAQPEKDKQYYCLSRRGGNRRKESRKAK